MPPELVPPALVLTVLEALPVAAPPALRCRTPDPPPPPPALGEEVAVLGDLPTEVALDAGPGISSNRLMCFVENVMLCAVVAPVSVPKLLLKNTLLIKGIKNIYNESRFTFNLS